MSPRRRRRVTAYVVAAVAVVVLAVAVPLGWSAVTSGQANQGGQADGAKPIASATLGGTAPGSLISATTMPDFDKTPTGRRLQSARVVYVSTEGDTGKPTEVSGSVSASYDFDTGMGLLTPWVQYVYRGHEWARNAGTAPAARQKEHGGPIQPPA